jgi:hypothetical protein
MNKEEIYKLVYNNDNLEKIKKIYNKLMKQSPKRKKKIIVPDEVIKAIVEESKAKKVVVEALNKLNKANKVLTEALNKLNKADKVLTEAFNKSNEVKNLLKPRSK